MKVHLELPSFQKWLQHFQHIQRILASLLHVKYSKSLLVLLAIKHNVLECLIWLNCTQLQQFEDPIRSTHLDVDQILLAVLPVPLQISFLQRHLEVLREQLPELHFVSVHGKRFVEDVSELFDYVYCVV